MQLKRGYIQFSIALKHICDYACSISDNDSKKKKEQKKQQQTKQLVIISC